MVEEVAGGELDKKVKRWDHIPVRPSTFADFRRLKDTRSDNEFVMKLLTAYKEERKV